tara:strand:+ start:409 stop:657 length:249 start_codon:yes stop_codon:yes gene_type:complete
MITVRCKECGKEITSVSGRTKSCGCPNMTTVTGDVVSAIDLTRTIVVRSNQVKEKTSLSADDLAFQEKRRKRKVKKLNFEIR